VAEVGGTISTTTFRSSRLILLNFRPQEVLCAFLARARQELRP
jgi:hypothetical protein